MALGGRGLQHLVCSKQQCRAEPGKALPSSKRVAAKSGVKKRREQEVFISCSEMVGG